MNYLLEEIVDEEIFSSTVVNDELLFISNNSLLFFNNDLIATVPFGNLKTYKGERDLITISNEKGLFVFDGNGEQIYHYENIFNEHIYCRNNIICVKNEEGITFIDLKKRYPVKLVRQKKIIKLHKFNNKVYFCTENAVFLIANMKIEKFYEFSDIIDFFIGKNNAILILFKKNLHNYLFFKEKNEKTFAKNLIYADKNIVSFFTKNSISFINLEEKNIKIKTVIIREVKKITSLKFVNQYLGFLTADKCTYKIRFFN